MNNSRYTASEILRQAQNDKLKIKKMFGRKNKTGKTAPEFPSNLEWINSEPMTLKELRGKVVLLDFWTYSCVNCQRTLPSLKSWHEKYADKGLVIIGIHTPEFDFEKVKANVEEAVREAGLEYATVLDPDYKIWNLFDNHWWPRKILVNKDGEIVYDHIGEGGYGKTERAIQSALREIGAKSLPAVHELEESSGGKVCQPISPETYLGYERGRFANHGELEKNQMHGYKKSKMRDHPILEGEWKVTREYVESGGGALYMPFMAGEVNLVMELADGASSKGSVGVSIDGKPIARMDAGNDVKFSGKATVVEVSSSRMYKILLADEYLDAMMKLDVPAGVRLFAFTFGGACK